MTPYRKDPAERWTRPVIWAGGGQGRTLVRASDREVGLTEVRPYG